MLIPARFREPIERGEVTLTFRRWKRCQVVAGHTYRTAAGRIVVDAVEVVDPDAITTADAPTCRLRVRRPTCVAILPATADLPTYRIQLHAAGDDDPRATLAASAALAEERADIDRRLGRLDSASRHGPWTHAVLQVIAGNPGVRAPDLAQKFGRETQPFKLDVRKLKNLGLTLGLRVGYRLSPRGEAYLSRRRV